MLFENEVLGKFVKKEIEVGNHTIAYEVGQSEKTPERTYILSHGASGTRNYMKVLAKEIVEKTASRVILIDLPYHGDSKGDLTKLSEITVHDYADTAFDFIAKLRENNEILGKLAWIGWSMGGSIGLLLDLKGANIDELVMLNSSPVWESIQGLQENVPAILDVNAIKEIFRQIEVADFKSNMTKEEYDEALGNYENLIAIPEVMVQDFNAILPSVFDVRDKLGEIKAKTLILGGTQDSVALVEQQELMNARIPDVKLVMFEDTHSMLVKPTIVKELVKELQARFN